MDPREKIEVSELEKLFREYEIRKLSNVVMERIVTLVIAGLGLVAALAWDETLHQFFQEFIGQTDSLGGKVTYAILVTIIAAVISIGLGRLLLRRGRRGR